MKKLNITKESFDKSRYLKHKYGNLKFVSESGKLFKTDTGKILKFVRESVEYDYQLVYDWVKRARTAVVDATVGLMDEQSKKILLNDAIDCLRLLDDAFKDSAADLVGTKFHINETPSVVDTQADPAPVEPLQEVNESKLSNIDLTQAEVDVIDKVGEESKCDWFGLCGTDKGKTVTGDGESRCGLVALVAQEQPVHHEGEQGQCQNQITEGHIVNHASPSTGRRQGCGACGTW